MGIHAARNTSHKYLYLDGTCATTRSFTAFGSSCTAVIILSNLHTKQLKSVRCYLCALAKIIMRISHNFLFNNAVNKFEHLVLNFCH